MESTFQPNYSKQGSSSNSSHQKSNSLLVILKVAVATKTTADRITSYNYPAETHQVTTIDGYILTMFRIPYSPKLQNQYSHRPVVYIQHGLGLLSDSFILNGPDNAIPYLFADAGYDVWLGNNRGTNYSLKHVQLQASQAEYWDFTWNEIAIYDISAMIDYILEFTNQDALHYVGHSQGTTTFFALMASRPLYNSKIKTGHMLAPFAYLSHGKSVLYKILSPVVNNYATLTDLIGNSVLMPIQKLMSLLGMQSCQETSPFPQACANFLLLAGGFNYDHTNISLLPELFETHPAPASAKQIVHYAQEYNSGHFTRFDYGHLRNLLEYLQPVPRDYRKKNIVAPLYFYYSDNDYFIAAEDAEKTARLMPNLKKIFHVPFRDWTHFDYLWGKEVKELLYDRIINATNDYEKTKIK